MELVVLVLGSGILAVIGIGIGMLLAPRLDRWAAPRPPAESPHEEATGAAPQHPADEQRPQDERPDEHP
jgi:hypothetical protein